jgi:hypothetical protein
MTPVGLVQGDVFLIVAAIAIPIAAVAFILVGPLLRNLGKGRFSVEFEHDLDPGTLRDSDAEAESAEVREEEIRQLVEAKAFRQAARGETPLNVESEVGRLLADQPESDLAGDPTLVEEVRQLVVARNARRERRGEPPLDVESEVTRQLRELENLGQ